MSQPTLVLPDFERSLICGSVALCSLAVSTFHRFGMIRYCKILSQYRLGGAVVLLAIAILGKGLLPVAVIALVGVVSARQVVQDLYQSRPTSRLVNPEI